MQVNAGELEVWIEFAGARKGFVVAKRRGFMVAKRKESRLVEVLITGVQKI